MLQASSAITTVAGGRCVRSVADTGRSAHVQGAQHEKPLLQRTSLHEIRPSIDDINSLAQNSPPGEILWSGEVGAVWNL